jgi:hypothetical protein
VNELDDQRQELANALMEWASAGAPAQDVVDAVEALIDAKLSQRQQLPLTVSEEVTRLRAALEQCSKYCDCSYKIVGIVDAALAGMPPYDFKNEAKPSEKAKEKEKTGK